ncbi:MAG: hypothetical protein ACI9TH_004917 [Kiritimatiellia bacterium]|jgi:uncharacterized protein with PIN domain
MNESDDDFEELDDDESPIQLIPPELHSMETDQPFTHCVDCGQELRENYGEYMVQKAQHRGETIFEFALCNTCHDHIRQGFSKETVERLNQYFGLQDFAGEGLRSCLDCGRRREDVDSFTMAGSCYGPFLAAGMMICSECQTNIQDLISEQTRKSWDDWVGKTFPCAPESEDVPKNRPVMF